MIQIQNTSLSYNGKDKAVDGISLDVRDGEIFGFLGPNGAGKTTTIKLITGILSPDEGDVVVNGYSIQKEPLAAKKSFGYVPDNPDIFLRLKGLEYLRFNGRRVRCADGRPAGTDSGPFPAVRTGRRAG